MPIGIIMAMDIDKKGKNKKPETLNYLAIFIIATAFALWLIIPTIIRDRLYLDVYFYLLYLICWTWWGIILLSLRLFSKRMMRNKNDKLANIIVIIEIIIGFSGLPVLGEILFKQAGLISVLYCTAPLILGCFALLFILIKPNRE
jgi:hypothetical protein